MSKIDTIAQSDIAIGTGAASIAKLQAVDSVIALVGSMADGGAPAFNLPDPAKLESIYKQARPMVQKRFDRECDALAVIAQSGAQALLQLNSEGRNNVAAAAGRLLREVETGRGRAVRLFQ